MKNHLLLVVLDGMGDRPVVSLGGRTPLEAAKTPTLDYLAKKGQVGLIEPIFKGPFPTSKDAHLSLFGYSLNQWNMGRGVFEAAGLGLRLKKGDIAFRGNWATVNESLKVVDRRAGRIEKAQPLVKALKKLHRLSGVKFILKAGIEHRFALVMRGKGLSDQISPNDFHQTNVQVSRITSLDGKPESKRTALLLNQFIDEAHKILENNSFNKKRKAQGLLPANYLLLRGAGELKYIPPFEKKWGIPGAFITGGGLYRGIAKILGMKEIKVKGANGEVTTNLVGKFTTGAKIIKRFPFLFLHVKGTDIYGHDGDCRGKKNFLEKIDQAMAPLLELKKTTIIVTADHCTPCELKQHSTDLIPVLIWSKKIREDAIQSWGERECQKGGLGLIRQNQLLKRAFDQFV